MIVPIPFKPHRFRSAAGHYLAGRPTYATTLVPRVAQVCGLLPAHRLLDLGCGPGQLALAFSSFVGTAVAIDPEPEMLRHALLAAGGCAPNVEFSLGSSYDIGLQLGRFRMATIGRAFHWMDRVDTVRVLDTMIEPDGAVVLFQVSHPLVPDNRWYRAYRAIIDRYAQDDPDLTKRLPSERTSHEAILLESRFRRLERLSIIERCQTPVERFVDRAFSMSSTSPSRIGSKVLAIAGEIRELMQRFALEGMVTEVIESSALIARRSAERISA